MSKMLDFKEVMKDVHDALLIDKAGEVPEEFDEYMAELTEESDLNDAEIDSGAYFFVAMHFMDKYEFDTDLLTVEEYPFVTDPLANFVTFINKHRVI